VAWEGSSCEAARPHGVDERLQVCGRGLSSGGEAGELAHQSTCAPGPLTQPGGPAQVDRLGRDKELDGDHPRGEIGHLVEAPRRQRRHGRAVLDPFSLGRTYDLEGDRVGEHARFRRDRLRGAAELGEGFLARVRLGRQAGRKARERALEQLDGAFGCSSDHRGESDAGKIERGGDRYDVKVADGHDAPLGEYHGGIALGGVELGLDRAPDVPEGVPGGAQDLGDATERQRILQVPGASRFKKRASGEQRSEPVERRNSARVRPDLGDHGMENAEIGPERLEVQGSGDIGFPEQLFGGEVG